MAAYSIGLITLCIKHFKGQCTRRLKMIFHIAAELIFMIVYVHIRCHFNKQQKSLIVKLKILC